MSSPSDQFRQTMADAGVIPDRPIEPDGTLHRFHVEGDKAGSLNGWAVLHGDGVPAGCFGSWKTGLFQTWSAKDRRNMSPGERASQKARFDRAKAMREQERTQRQARASKRAVALWGAALPAFFDHPYLVAKQVRSHHVRQLGESLLLPLRDFDGHLCSLQFIARDGAKKLLSGGRKRGCFIPVDGPQRSSDASRVLICEGWATGATLAESEPEALVLAAVDAGNLKPVTLAARKRWPDVDLIVCGDDDRKTPGNPGVVAALEAAKAAGAKLALPQWPVSAPLCLSDFNDLANWMRETVA